MSNELVTFGNEVLDVIKNTICKEATPAEFQAFVMQCKRTGLDPVTRQIYWMKDSKGRVQIQTSIDGFRLVAERSGAYEGQTQPLWCGEDGIWKDVWLSKETPSACKIGVYKKGFRDALYAVAIFEEYAQRYAYDDSKNNPPRFLAGDLTHMWAKMPSLMIAKVAESLALRKAFPNDLSGIYTQEEMGQTSNEKEVVSTLNKPVQIPNAIKPTIQPHFNNFANEANASAPVDKDKLEHYPISFGKFKGMKLGEVEPQELAGYVTFIEKSAIESGKAMAPNVEEFITLAKAFLE